MATKRQILQRWKSLIGYTAPGPWNEDHMEGYFQHFRPDGRGVEAVFEGVQLAEEILPRLMQVYEATARDFAPSDWYFEVKRPLASSAAEAQRLLEDDLGKMAEIARFQKDAELLASLDPLPSIRVEAGRGPPKQTDRSSFELHLSDAISDFVLSLKPRKSHALLLHEALSSIAASDKLADYILWPLYREASPVEEPFGPTFEMWRRGIDWSFEDDGRVRVYGRGIGPSAKTRLKTKRKAPSPAAGKTPKSRKKPSADWNLENKSKELQDSPHRFNDEFYLERIEARLGQEKGHYLLATIHLEGLALPLSTRGAIAVLQGDPSGWSDIQKGWRYRCWLYRVRAARFDDELQRQSGKKKRDKAAFETLGVKMEEAALCLATAIALGKDEVAHSCGDRLIRNFTKKDPLTEERVWYGTAFEPFMVKLYARWRGLEEGVLQKAHPDLIAQPKDGVDAYQQVLDGWDNDETFTAALEHWCHFHAEHTLDPDMSYRVVPYQVFPADIVAAVRVRIELGGTPPGLRHPVWQNPLADVPRPLPRPERDELLDRVIRKTQEQAPFIDVPWSDW